jgi:short-subunit dehydrogenase
MQVIRGRNAVITGAASGIGKAVTMELAAAGANVFLIDKDADALTLVAQEASKRGIQVLVSNCDLASPRETSTTIDQVLTRWKHVHILVNCAGVLCYGPLHLTPEEKWRQTMAVNLLAPIQIIYQLLETLLSADEGHIVNICSIFGLVPTKKFPVYHASKFGLVGFSLGLHSDYHRSGFGVTALCPGFVRTPMMENVADPEVHKRSPAPPEFLCSTPEAVAAAALSAIRRNQGLVVIGFFTRIVWWVTRFSPHLVDWINREGWRRRGKIFLSSHSK